LDDHDRLAVVWRLAKVVDAHQWICHSWCLMDTHLHGMIETPEPNLGRGMQLLVGWYARRFNLRHDREGHVFQGPYFAGRVEDESHFQSTAIYHALNPVLAGLCAAPHQYRWSSYRQTAGLDRGFGFLTTDIVLGSLHDDVDRARQLYQRTVAAVFEATRLGSMTAPG
jgi:REP-associated tyrosine transposase